MLIKQSHLVLLLSMLLLCLIGCKKNDQLDTASKPIENSSSSKDTLATASADDLKVLGEVPAFALIDQNGNPFQSEDLSGKIWVATFIFTRCGLTCPAQTAAFTKLQDHLRSINGLGRVQLVSITVDPEYDTPAALTQYGKNAGADFQHWRFLTGERNQIWDLSKDGFKLPVESARDEATIINHSQLFVLVDQESRVRGYYSGLSPAANLTLQNDIRLLLDKADPDWVNAVEDVFAPTDVMAPAWMAERATTQKAKSAEYDVFCDFKFADEAVRSGIVFKDQVVEDVTRLFKAAHYDHGTGVAVADVDMDGLLDIYFVSQLGPNELWRNLGDGRFENITERAGVAAADGVSVAASFADIDNDGDADLYATRVCAPNRLLLNDGTGRFEDVSEASGLDHIGHSSASTFFDYDRDGLVDLLLTNVGKYTTEVQGEGGYFIAYPAAFAGHLLRDRDEKSILFRNMGNARFENVNNQVGFDDVSWSGDATPIDANDDGWIDIYLLNMQGHDEYYENHEGKYFTKKSRELFPRTPWGSMGVKVFDYNRDGRLDLYVTDMHTDMVEDLSPESEKNKMRRNLPLNMLATDGNHILGNAFYRKDDKNQFTEISDSINAENYWPWGISVADLNADGFEDVFISASMSYPYRYAINSVLLNDLGKKFLDSEFVLGVEPRAKGTAQPWMRLDCSGKDSGLNTCKDYSGKVQVWGAIGTRSSVVFDIDGDGDLDIVTNDFGGTPMVLISNLSEQKVLRYLRVQLVGKQSNRDGLGATVEIHFDDKRFISVNDGKSGYLSQSSMPLYFGLGEADTVDRVVVKWLSGNAQTLEGPILPNQLLKITEE